MMRVLPSQMNEKNVLEAWITPRFARRDSLQNPVIQSVLVLFALTPSFKQVLSGDGANKKTSAISCRGFLYAFKKA